MTTLTLDDQHPGGGFIIVAAWSLIAGGVLQLALGIPLASLQAQNPPAMLIVALNMVSHLLLGAGVIGLARSGGASSAELKLAGAAITLLGIVLWITAEGSWLSGLGAAETVYAAATLALTVGLLLTGLSVIRTQRWTSWHRFSPLACGLYVPLVFIPSFALPGLATHYALGVWGLCWLLVGLALGAEETTQ